MTKPRFRQLERRFFELIAQPRALEEAALARRDLDPEILPLRGWISAPDEHIAATRLGIYAHMYFARLRDSLREDFELVARLCTPAAFDALAARYLERHPSQDPSLRHHGRAFPEFLAQARTSDDPGMPAVREDTADLARLEWARIDAFDAPSAPPLDRHTLLGLAPSAWERLRFRSVPAARLLEVGFGVSELWQALDQDLPAPEPVRSPERVLVWRREFRVYHRSVDEAEAAALRALAAGSDLSGLCACFAQDGAPEAECALRAFGALEQWLADELVTTDSAP